MRDCTYSQAGARWRRKELHRFELIEVDQRIVEDSSVTAAVTCEEGHCCLRGLVGIVASIPGGREPMAFVRFWHDRNPVLVPLRGLRLVGPVVATFVYRE